MIPPTFGNWVGGMLCPHLPLPSNNSCNDSYNPEAGAIIVIDCVAVMCHNCFFVCITLSNILLFGYRGEKKNRKRGVKVVHIGTYIRIIWTLQGFLFSFIISFLFLCLFDVIFFLFLRHFILFPISFYVVPLGSLLAS